MSARELRFAVRYIEDEIARMSRDLETLRAARSALLRREKTRPLDRPRPKCGNCGRPGHNRKRCPET